MPDAREPVRPGARRPWYLVLALLICTGLGACGSTTGWGTIEIYRGAAFDNRSHEFTREQDSKAVAAAGDRILAAMDEERPRAFPLSAGDVVLGVAMFLFASAALMGRGGARRALIQLMLAQTALVVATFVLTPHYRHAQIDWVIVQQAAKDLEAGQTQVDIDRAVPVWRAFYGGISVVALIVRAAAGGLVVVALTRKRSREFYEAQQTSSES